MCVSFSLLLFIKYYTLYLKIVTYIKAFYFCHRYCANSVQNGTQPTESLASLSNPRSPSAASQPGVSSASPPSDWNKQTNKQSPTYNKSNGNSTVKHLFIYFFKFHIYNQVLKHLHTLCPLAWLVFFIFFCVFFFCKVIKILLSCSNIQKSSYLAPNVTSQQK